MKAFPSNYTKTEVTETGMDLRDYFAAKAMPIVVSIWNDVIKTNPDQDWGSETLTTADYELIAIDCYEMADAMMKARETNE